MDTEDENGGYYDGFLSAVGLGEDQDATERARRMVAAVLLAGVAAGGMYGGHMVWDAYTNKMLSLLGIAKDGVVGLAEPIAGVAQEFFDINVIGGKG